MTYSLGVEAFAKLRPPVSHTRNPVIPLDGILLQAHERVVCKL